MYNTDNTYRDLRSASREQHRYRKRLDRYNNFRGLDPIDLPSHPSQQSHYLPVCMKPECPKYYTDDVHAQFEFPHPVIEAPIAVFTKREAYDHARGTWPITRHHSRPKEDLPKYDGRQHRKREAHNDIEYDDRWYIDMVESELDYYMSCCWQDDDTIFYLKKSGVENAEEVLNSRDAWTEVGEPFSTWCQRRIHEMRMVKESRLRAQLRARLAQEKNGAAQQNDKISTDDDDDEGYFSSSSSSIPTTTLPTTDSDKEGHALIKSVLRLDEYLRRRQKWIEFPRICGFCWFGEFEWYWHRNATGCWALSEWGCYPSCGPECHKWDAWPDWDPEGVQRYDLAEFVKGEGWNGLWDEDDDSEEDDVADVEGGDEDWDVISTASASTAWTEIED